jgi:hypothetical protein
LSTRSKEVRFKERSVYICTISAKLIVTLSSFLHIVTLSSSLHNSGTLQNLAGRRRSSAVAVTPTTPPASL